MDILKIDQNASVNDDQLKNLNSEYFGRKVDLFKDGKLIAQKDTRDIFQEKKQMILELRRIITERILEVAPLIDQINAAAGRLPAAETATLNDAIDNERTKYKKIKAQILDAMSLAELEAISLE